VQELLAAVARVTATHTARGRRAHALPRADFAWPPEHRCSSAECRVELCARVRVWLRDGERALYVHACCERPGCDDAAVHAGDGAGRWRRTEALDLGAGALAVCLDTGAWHVCAASFVTEGDDDDDDDAAASGTGHPTAHGAARCPAALQRVAAEGTTVCRMTGRVIAARQVATVEDMRLWASGTSMQCASDQALAAMLLGGGGGGGDGESERRMRAGGGTVTHRRGFAHHNADISGKIQRYQRTYAAAANAPARPRTRSVPEATSAGGSGSGGGGGGGGAGFMRSRLAVGVPALADPGSPSPGGMRAHPPTASLRRLATLHAAREAAATDDLESSAAGDGSGGWGQRSPGVVERLRHTVTLVRHTRRRSKRSATGERRAVATAPRDHEERTVEFVRGSASVVGVHRLDSSVLLAALLSARRTHCDMARLAERETAALAAVWRAATDARTQGTVLPLPHLLCMYYKLANAAAHPEPFVAPADKSECAALLRYMQNLVLRFWHSVTSTAVGRDAVLLPPINGDFRACVYPIIGLLAQGVAVPCPAAIAGDARLRGVDRVWVVPRDELSWRLYVRERATIEELGLPANTHGAAVALRTAITQPLYDPAVEADAERWIALLERLRVDGSLLGDSADEAWLRRVYLIDRGGAAAAAEK
jgi:hypothetical protein